MLGDTSDAPFTGSTPPKKKVADFRLHHLDTVEPVVKLWEVWLLESIFTADDLLKSLQQHDL